MIEPGQDYAGEVDDANQYITDPDDPAPKPKGRYKQDWESGRTVDRHDPDYTETWTGEQINNKPNRSNAWGC